MSGKLEKKRFWSVYIHFSKLLFEGNGIKRWSCWPWCRKSSGEWSHCLQSQSNSTSSEPVWDLTSRSKQATHLGRRSDQAAAYSPDNDDYTREAECDVSACSSSMTPESFYIWHWGVFSSNTWCHCKQPRAIVDRVWDNHSLRSGSYRELVVGPGAVPSWPPWPPSILWSVQKQTGWSRSGRKIACQYRNRLGGLEAEGKLPWSLDLACFR